MESDKALRFVAAQPNSGAYNVSAMDSDLYSWVIMNGDLFPASSGGAAGVPDAPLLFDPEANVHHQGEDQEVASHAVAAPQSSTLDVKEETNGQASIKTEPAIDSDGGRSNGEGEDTKHLSPEAKRKRRLEKNREIARNCRKRKRERFNQLEEEVVRLRQYNQQLEMKINQGKSSKERADIRQNEVRAIETFMKESNVDALKEKLLTYKDLYSDFGRERRSAIKYHMEQLKSLLIPNQVSKMTLWSLQQDDDFYDEKTNQKTFGGGIWNMLCSTLNLTAEQKRGLIDMRHGIRKQRRNIAECLRIMNELDGRVKTNFDHMSGQMDTIMSLITPVQQAKFLMWIEKNQACMHMLNNMWKDDVKIHGPSSSAMSAAAHTATSSKDKKPVESYSESPTSNDGEDETAEIVTPSDMAAVLKKQSVVAGAKATTGDAQK